MPRIRPARIAPAQRWQPADDHVAEAWCRVIVSIPARKARSLYQNTRIAYCAVFAYRGINNLRGINAGLENPHAA
jgi:hypothetical protein